MSAKQTRARLQFLSWLRKSDPTLYNAAVGKAERQTKNGKLAGLGEEQQPSFWQKITSAITSVGTTYLSVKNQKDIMKLNLQRAEQGLPPIDASTTAPVIRTQIDLPPDMIDKITAEAGLSMNKLLLFGAVALGAVFFMKRR